METTNTDQNQIPVIKGSVPILIKNSWIGVLTLILCVIPLPLLYFLSPNPENISNKFAALFTIPMFIAIILLPFTGILRKILYAIFRPGNLNKQDPFHMLLYSFDVLLAIAVGWVMVGMGFLMLILTLATINK